MRNFINIVEDLTDAPDVVKRAASGNWPETLHGDDLVMIRVLIDAGMDSAEWFDAAYAEAMEIGEVEDYEREGTTAHLRQVNIAELEMPEEGVADPEVVDDYVASDGNFPPVIVVGRVLRDGYHRVAAARKRGETQILAYVIS